MEPVSELDRAYNRRDLLTVAAVSLAARLVMAAVFPVLIAPDSASYLELARAIGAWDFTGYNGARTPVYPLLILATGVAPGRVVLIQHVLGIITAILVYSIFLRVTGRRPWALAAALTAGLNPGLIAIERAVLTESLSAFLLVATTGVFLRALDNPGRSGRWLTATSLLAAITALARPAMLFLPPLLGLLAFVQPDQSRFGRRIRRGCLAMVPALVPLLLWCGFNYSTVGYFTPTTVGGVALINHAGAFIEDAPPEYDQVKRIYLRHRAEQIAEHGHQRMTFWYAYRELMDSTGMSFPELDKQFKEISLGLIVRNPLLYLRSVAHSFIRFWRAAWYTGQGGIAAAILGGGPAMKLLVGGFVIIHTLLTGIFLLLPVVVTAWRELRARLRPNYRWLVVYAVVFGGALLQALADAGENPRYGIPFEPLVLGAGAIGLMAAIGAVANKYYHNR